MCNHPRKEKSASSDDEARNLSDGKRKGEDDGYDSEGYDLGHTRLANEMSLKGKGGKGRLTLALVSFMVFVYVNNSHVTFCPCHSHR